MRTHLATLVEQFRRHPAETAVISHRGNRRYRTTYGELANLAGRFAAELERRTIGPGQRVVLWGENSAEWIAAFFGCMMRGVLAVPLDAAGATEFVERVIEDVSPKLIVGDRNLLASLTTDGLNVKVPQLCLSELSAKLPPDPIFEISDSVDAQTPFQIVFTSGTTSEPKGIVHTHRNVLASLQPIEDEIAKYRKYERLAHPLRFLHTLPLSHVFGQFMGLWVPPLLAAELHFVEQLEARRMTQIIQRNRISVLVAVPRVLQILRSHLLLQFNSLAAEMEHVEGLRIWKRWWRFRRVHKALGWKFWAVISGGATLPSDLEAFWNRLGFALIQGYGMTETAALVTLNHPFRIGQGTIGKALPGREVRITGDGEIQVRGDMLAAATWQGGNMRPREGDWLATGDLATESAAGELRFAGRKGDVIVTSAGMNIHPADLEQALNRQPGVRGSVVVPCEIAGSVEPVAVLLFPGRDEDLGAAVADANRALATYQQIRRVLKWPELQFPYTSTGKLLRRKVAEWACATILGQQQQQSDARDQDVLLDLIAGITGEPPSGNENHLRLSEDLHLDSLGRVQLQTELEQRLGLELDDDAIANVVTLGGLRELLQRASDQGTPPPAPAATAISSATAAKETIDSNLNSISTLERRPNAQTIPSPANIETAQRSKAAPPEHVYPRWPWSWPIRAIRMAFIELVMRPLIWALAAPRVVRRTHPLPQSPLLVIANHVTAYDGALVLYALPGRLRRRMAIAMSGEMLMDFRRARNQRNAFYNLLGPAAYWLVTALFNVFPLPRRRGFRRSFKHAGEAMDFGHSGYSVLIFPEGTRSRDGELAPFRPGIGLLAQQSRVPVLPVALIGLGKARKSWSFRSAHLEIRIGEPIPIPHDEDDDDIDPAQLTIQFEQSVRQLLQ